MRRLAFLVEVLNSIPDARVEVGDVPERAVGQVVALEVTPGALNVVQLRGVARQPLDGDPGPLGQRCPSTARRNSPLRSMSRRGLSLGGHTLATIVTAGQHRGTASRVRSAPDVAVRSLLSPAESLEPAYAAPVCRPNHPDA